MPNVTRIINQQHRATASVHFALHALTRQALRSGNRRRQNGRRSGAPSPQPQTRSSD
jgi:hypothetical protein